MEIALILIGCVALLVGVAAVSRRVRVAAPLLLVAIGIALGFLPGVPLIQIDPEVVLVGLLPALLYAAAIQVPIIDFRRNIRPIAGLSVLLVLITALIVGAVVHFIFPQIPMPLGVAIGAVIAPPDAVAATSIAKQVGLPHRLVSILEGESLVNDATSLVLLRTAVAAIAGGFVFWNSVGLFFYAALVAMAIGFVIGVLVVWVRARISNPVYDTVISFTVPFIAFIPAEFIHASGVLAVVTTGLYVGHHATRKFSASARTSQRMNWRTVQFLLENGVFLLMGLQLHSLVDQVSTQTFGLTQIGLLALGLVGILIVTRALFMFPLIWTMRFRTRTYENLSEAFHSLTQRLSGRNKLSPKERRRLERAKRAERRAQADLAHEQEEGLDFRDATVLSWSAMRGVVTLAAAQTIPTSISLRPQIVLVAFFVAVATLMLHGLTLPGMIRLLQPNMRSLDLTKAELSSISRDLFEAGKEVIDEFLQSEGARGVDEKKLDVIRKRLELSAREAVAPLMLLLPVEVADDDRAKRQRKYLQLAHEVLEAQRQTLLEEQAIGRYHSSTLARAQDALDRQDARLRPPEDL
jgi:NhaP-type Na+/H+ or K+/H+ antiporter